jgi:hypothetical protein
VIKLGAVHPHHPNLSEPEGAWSRPLTLRYFLPRGKAPAGASATVRAFSPIRLKSESQIVDERRYFDTGRFFAQLTLYD